MEMEEKGGCCGSSCMGGKCSGMHGTMCHGHLLKKVVTIVMMIFVFWLGLQLGEVRSFKMMNGYREYGNSGYGYRMMGGQYNQGSWAPVGEPGAVLPQTTTGTTK